MFSALGHMPLRLGGIDSRTRSTNDISGTYNFGISGVALGIRFVAPVTTTIASFHFYIDAFNGTPDDVVVELRNVGAGADDVGTLIASEHYAPSAPRWQTVNFATPPAVTAGTIYYLVVGNNSIDSGANYPVLIQDGGLDGSFKDARSFRRAKTTNGFATNALSSIRLPPMVVEFSDGSVLGNPYLDVQTSPVNDAYPKGLRVRFDHPVIISGADWAPGGQSAVDRLRIFEAPAEFVDPPLRDVVLAPQVYAIGHTRFAPLVLKPKTEYRIVIANNGELSSFLSVDRAVMKIGPVDPDPPAAVLQAGYAGGEFFFTHADSGGEWFDFPNSLPLMTLLLDNIQPVPVVNPGTRGGID